MEYKYKQIVFSMIILGFPGAKSFARDLRCPIRGTSYDIFTFDNSTNQNSSVNRDYLSERFNISVCSSFSKTDIENSCDIVTNSSSFEESEESRFANAKDVMMIQRIEIGFRECILFHTKDIKLTKYDSRMKNQMKIYFQVGGIKLPNGLISRKSYQVNYGLRSPMVSKNTVIENDVLKAALRQNSYRWKNLDLITRYEQNQLDGTVFQRSIIVIDGLDYKIFGDLNLVKLIDTTVLIVVCFILNQAHLFQIKGNHILHIYLFSSIGYTIITLLISVVGVKDLILNSFTQLIFFGLLLFFTKGLPNNKKTKICVVGNTVKLLEVEALLAEYFEDRLSIWILASQCAFIIWLITRIVFNTKQLNPKSRILPLEVYLSITVILRLVSLVYTIRHPYVTITLGGRIASLHPLINIKQNENLKMYFYLMSLLLAFLRGVSVVFFKRQRHKKQFELYYANIGCYEGLYMNSIQKNKVLKALNSLDPLSWPDQQSENNVSEPSHHSQSQVFFEEENDHETISSLEGRNQTEETKNITESDSSDNSSSYSSGSEEKENHGSSSSVRDETYDQQAREKIYDKQKTEESSMNS